MIATSSDLIIESNMPAVGRCWTHSKRLSFEKPGDEREKATIQQDKGSLLVQRTKLGLFPNRGSHDQHWG